MFSFRRSFFDARGKVRFEDPVKYEKHFSYFEKFFFSRIAPFAKPILVVIEGKGGDFRVSSLNLRFFL
jgi:hypothetical protein